MPGLLSGPGATCPGSAGTQKRYWFGTTPPFLRESTLTVSSAANAAGAIAIGDMTTQVPSAIPIEAFLIICFLPRLRTPPGFSSRRILRLAEKLFQRVGAGLRHLDIRRRQRRASDADGADD